MFSKKHFTRLIVTVFFCTPMLAMAGWQDTLVDLANNLRIGLYAIGGTLALSTLVWSGIKWLIARSQGDQSHTFMDYMQQVVVIMAVGGAVLLAAGAWDVFGSGGAT